MTVIDSPKSDALQVADRFFSAIETGDIKTIEAIYAPDGIVWHNYDPLDAREGAPAKNSVQDNIALLSALPQAVTNLRYDLLDETTTETGFVRQHVVTGTTIDGDALSLPACVVADVSDDKITRLCEYISLTHLPPSLGAFLAENTPQ